MVKLLAISNGWGWFSRSRRVWLLALLLMPMPLSCTGIPDLSTVAVGQTAVPTGQSVVFWVQTMDSCQQAIPGATFKLTGPHFKVKAGPAPGSGPITVRAEHGNCPLQRGNCVAFKTGCLSWKIPIPASSSMKYQIQELTSAANYAVCAGGSVCPGGPAVVILTISSAGTISATVKNTYPNGVVVTWPTKGTYSGKASDPAVVHNFQLGSGSCDGDRDADDRLTGSPAIYCDSDHDRVQHN